MKKLFALLLALSMVAAFAVGCTPAEPVEEPAQTEAPAAEEPTEAPYVEGKRPEDRPYLEYEVIVPADGIGDHPAFAMLTDAKAAFEKIGITININDPADSNVLWDALDAGTQDMWTAAWGATIDPDMHQVYHSSNIVGLGGSDSNHYHIASEELDQYIMDARKSDDQSYRKTVYKMALDEIIDWAVELPTYQRQNCVIFSPQRIKMETVTPDITTFWTWLNDTQNIEMVNEGDPLVVAYDAFSEKFSPFFSDTAYDEDVAEVTGLQIMTTDRMGGIIYNAIEGETVSYNGTDYLYTGPADVKVEYDEASNTTTYTAKLREDLKFSDGKPVTADDIIFNYYVFLDPAYVGSTTMNTYDIIGLKNYQTQTNDDVYAKYYDIVTGIYGAGADHARSDADAWTQEMQDWYWDEMKTVWTEDVQAIVDYCMNNYLGAYAQDYVKHAPEEVQANEGLQVAFGMALWGYGQVGDDGVLTTASGATFDLVNSFPTIEDYYNETYAAYAGDPEAYWSVEAADGSDVFNTVNNNFIRHWGPLDPEGEGGIPSIAGITKVDDYTVQVKTNGYEAPAIYTLFGIYIAPLHYYGDESQYDYENNKFGHPFGDLSIVEAKTTQPMGAGPWKFIKYENKVVYFEANENYWEGAPKTQNMQWLETITSEVAAGVAAGTVDCGEMNGSRAYFEEIRGYNSNGELSGDVVVTSRVDNLGYGYMGFNADMINVKGESGSDASKNLRKALATVFAVYRDTTVNSYYGDAATVINYPISNTSWAAPQPTDSDYQLAFSVDVNGNPIYTSDMTQEQKYEAALQASLGFFEAAGFKVEDGKVVAGPAA